MPGPSRCWDPRTHGTRILPSKNQDENSTDADGKKHHGAEAVDSHVYIARVLWASHHPPNYTPSSRRGSSHQKPRRVPEGRRGSWCRLSPGTAPRSVWVSWGTGLWLMPPPCESATGHSHRVNPLGQTTLVIAEDAQRKLPVTFYVPNT